MKLVVRDQQGQLSLACPICRQDTPIPANGVTGLQSAFRVNDLLKIMEDHKKRKETAASQKGVEGDKTNPISSKRTTFCCCVHDGKELELYCETCGELICSHCVFRGQKHHSHEYDLISSCYEKYKKEVIPSLEPVEKQLTAVKKALADLDEHCGKISDQREVIEADIHRTTQRLHETIDVRKTELIRQLHQVTQEKLKSLATQRDELETILAQLGSCLEFVRESLETSSQGEVLKMKMTIIKQVAELTATSQPDTFKPNEEADVKFISSSDMTTLCQTYGHIGVPGRPDPSQCHATGKGIEVAEVRQKSTVIVQANDYKGELCKKDLALLQCELVSELTGAVVRGNVRRRGESQYEISYQPTVKGKHQLLIKVENEHIRGSPFSVKVKLPIEKLGTPIRIIDGVQGPADLAFNTSGEMVVIEGAENCVTFFSLSGQRLRSFGSHGSGLGQFDLPGGVTLDGDGNILVADCDNHRIQKFTANGQFLAAVGTEGDGPTQFNSPNGIVWNAINDKIYVTDYCNHRIQVLNSDLTLSYTFGKLGSGKGQFSDPCGISCDSSGKVYVADYGNNRIQVFTSKGKLVRMFGRCGQGKGELNGPADTTVDADGVVYVAEYNHRISVFTSEGQFMTSFGGMGNEPGKFSHPCGLEVNNSGVVYVCDADNDRIQLF